MPALASASASRRVAVLVAIVAASAALVFVFAPLRQDQAYHVFADNRTFLGIPNALDVLSNLGFLAVGLVGLARALRDTPLRSAPLTLVFGGVFLTAFGSAWYHLAPSDERLFWDRLPMTIGFGAMAALVVEERIDAAWGVRLLPLFVLLTAGTA